MAFIQPLFLVGTIVVGATNVAVLGLYFTFRTIFYYLYGRVENKVIINISKSDFETLKPIQKICVSLFYSYSLSFQSITVYSILYSRNIHISNRCKGRQQVEMMANRLNNI